MIGNPRAIFKSTGSIVFTIHSLSRILTAGLVCILSFILSFVGGVQAQGGPSGKIAFSHEESGTTDPLQRYFNLYTLDVQNPTQLTPLTSFSQPPITVSTPIWSRDFSTLAFTSNLNNGLYSLEENSIYTMAADGSNLNQITGFGVLNPLPPPTGTVIGHVRAPAIAGLSAGQVSGCVISVQGAPQSVACGDDDGNGRTFIITGVPAASFWVRVQGEVSYPETPGDPGLSWGFSVISVVPDGVIDVGTILLTPNFPKSIEPAWSRDGTQLVKTNEVLGKNYQFDPNTLRFRWVPTGSHSLQVWTATGQFVRGIPNPTGLESFGSDWSPTADQICFAAAGTSAFQSYVYLESPDGSNAQQIYRVPFQFNALPFVTFCRFSPDGQRIAFLQTSDPALGGPWWADLYVINVNGTGLQQITGNNPGGFVSVPTWSPDGQAIAFEFDVNSASPPTLIPQSADLFIYDFNNPTTFTQLTNDGSSFTPTWAPN